MGKLEPSKLKSLLQNYGCVNELLGRYDTAAIIISNIVISTIIMAL